jgi:RNA polymerase sigma-70 factor (ECF subfamily)
LPREVEDLELARELLAGSPEAFDRFVDLYHKRLFQYAYLMCGQREDAEEVSQDTLLSVFATIDQLRDPGRLKAWVFRIAKNACLMKRRKSVFAPSRVLSLEELAPARFEGDRTIELADWSRLPDAGLLRSELRDVLNRAIGDLPEMYRSVLLLREVEGFSTTEAAEILDVNEAVVKQRLHRARLSVRATMDGYLRSQEVHANGKGIDRSS